VNSLSATSVGIDPYPNGKTYFVSCLQKHISHTKLTQMLPPSPIYSPHTSPLLASLQCQGQSNDCGPYTCATVINALLGLSLEAAELAQQMNRPRWRGAWFVVRRLPNWATFPWGIVDVLREHGLNASWRPFAKTAYLLEGLQQGYVLMPILGGWRPLWAHVMTLVAWDVEKGWGFANTQFAHHDIHWLSDVLFQGQWRAMAHLLIEVRV
jgi:hypothetical protein